MALAALLLLPGPLSASGLSGPEPQERTLLPRRFVADTTRPTLVMLTAEWCQPCHAMKQTVFKDPAVAGALGRRNVVILDIDTFDGAVVAERFASIGYQRAVPFFALFSAAQDSVSVMTGGCDAALFLKFLERFPAATDAEASDSWMQALDGKVKKPLPEWQPELSVSGNISFLSGASATKKSPLPGWGLSAGVRRNLSERSALCAALGLTAAGGRAPSLLDSDPLRRYLLLVPVGYERRICGFGPEASLRCRAGLWGGLILKEGLSDAGADISLSVDTGALDIALRYSRGFRNHDGFTNSVSLGIRLHL